MYVAHFSARKREPERVYFSVKRQEPKRIKFFAEKKEPVKLIMDSNLKLEVQD